MESKAGSSVKTAAEVSLNDGSQEFVTGVENFKELSDIDVEIEFLVLL